MTHFKPVSMAAWAGFGLLGLAGTANAQFVLDNSGNPTGAGIASATENVDFGDVDHDGDWDAIFADGGDDAQDQNRIWINRGGLQAGPIGDFLDQTTTRMPTINDDSRDIEFADIDNDGDLDIYVSNTAQLVNQGNRWHVNNGGEQGGTLGFYTDETSTRWVGLGQAGSSIPANQVLGDGTFIDWSCDCDFGDLDNDGDLDLVHGTYGGAFGGQVPTRLFLNDGDGHFSEFNPSGFQLTTTNIANGQPALWAQGVHQTNTTNSTGTQADIASSALDLDVGDMDGDFDLDLLHGARQEGPRLFKNMLEENGSLAFRDVSGTAWPAGYWDGGDNYEQEMGDMDEDGDLDIYGLNYGINDGGGPGNSLSDRTFRNNGAMVFANAQTVVPSSTADDNEADYLDYDNDGDLDVIVANFSGQDKLYRNSDGLGNLVLQQSMGVTGQASSLDSDACDIDNDGDYDIIVAEDNNQPNNTLINTTNVPDTHAPYLPNVENPGNQTAATGVLPLRVQVYDNIAYYITWYNPTTLTVSVDGCTLPGTFNVRSSAGQIFRAEVPANLVGNVSLQWRSEDEYGNAGAAAPANYVGSSGLGFTSKFGPSTLSNLTGQSPSLDLLSVPFAGSTMYLATRGAAGVPYISAVYTAQIPGGLPLPGIALINISGIKILQVSGTLDASGCAVISLALNATVPPGTTVYGQAFTFEGATNGDLLASSQGTTIITQ